MANAKTADDGPDKTYCEQYDRPKVLWSAAEVDRITSLEYLDADGSGAPTEMTGYQRDEPSSRHPAAIEDQRRRLELELQCIRSEARAARLDAQAAKIELMIRHFEGSCGPTTSAANTLTVAPEPETDLSATGHSATGHSATGHSATGHSETGHSETGHSATVLSATAGPDIVTPPFSDWEDLRNVMPQPSESLPTDRSPTPFPCQLSDGKHEADVSPATAEPSPAETPKIIEQERDATVVGEPIIPQGPDATVVGEPIIEDEIPQTESGRRRPAAWLVSLAAHLGVLLILAAITLQHHRPKDQVALSASSAESEEVSIETFTIEVSEPVSEAVEPTPADPVDELSPTGELSVVDFRPDVPPTPLSSVASALTAPAAATAISLRSDAKIKTEFCGVEGGGNHFVYLVDSSGSMGAAFESARRELLRSIDQLKPEQRFYVIFFDAEPDYMRLADPSQDEPRSVYATPDHKAALKRWATRISMDRGKAPYDPLRFALQLKPDVVFLLSDGEFPQGIEDLLREENKVQNLFGDRHPICIVHTIGYHSKEGESRMRRIAKQNEGQYRHVPAP